MPLGAVAVAGRSMLPLLAEGDYLLVRWGAPARAGDVVVGVLRDRPELQVVKRAVRAVDDGWLLASDNAGEPGAVSGVGDVQAVVVARYWPPGRLGPVRRGLRPRRSAALPPG